MKKDIMIKIFKKGKLIDGAKIASKNRLFVNGWVLGDQLRDLKRIREDRYDLLKRRLILIAYKNDIDQLPVGCCYIINKQIMIFIRKRFRRQGIASELYWKAVKEQNVKNHFNTYGDFGTGEKFFSTIYCVKIKDKLKEL